MFTVNTHGYKDRNSSVERENAPSATSQRWLCRLRAALSVSCLLHNAVSFRCEVNLAVSCRYSNVEKASLKVTIYRA